MQRYPVEANDCHPECGYYYEVEVIVMILIAYASH